MDNIQPSELNQRSYSLPLRLNLAIKISVAGALIFGISAANGDGIAKKDICFYPESAQIHDAEIRVRRGEHHRRNLRAKYITEPQLLFGNKYCRHEQISQIPEPYLKAALFKTANPKFNPWAYLASDGLNSKALWVLRDLPADNPWKIQLGLATMLFGAVGLWATSLAQDYLADIRPHYRATKQFESVRASKSLKLGEQLLDLSGIELLKYLRGIKIAQARQQFISSITPQQVTALLIAMSADDYYEFGHLLDAGQSFDKFEPTTLTGQLPHATPGTLAEQMQQVTVAGDERQAMPAATPQDNASGGDSKYRWINNAIGYPTLIFGGMGAGKSWTTREIIWAKRLAGWNIVVLDPHGTAVEWSGVRLITGYQEIADFMKWYLGEMRQRYDNYRNSGMTEEQWTAHLRTSNQHFSVVCEEFTTWVDNITDDDPDLVAKFFRCAMTESRKQLMVPLFVAHDRTMEILAKAKGLSKLRDAALLEIELIAHVDPVTTEARASGQGAIKLPGHGQWLPIELPKLTKKRVDFHLDRQASAPTAADSTLYDDIDKIISSLNAAYLKSEFGIDKSQDLAQEGFDISETAKQPDETPQPPNHNHNEQLQERFTRFNLTREQVVAEIERLRNELKMNQTNIIKFLWGAKPGDNEAYRNAVSQYKELMG